MIYSLHFSNFRSTLSSINTSRRDKRQVPDVSRRVNFSCQSTLDSSSILAHFTHTYVEQISLSLSRFSFVTYSPRCCLTDWVSASIVLFGTLSYSTRELHKAVAVVKIESSVLCSFWVVAVAMAHGHGDQAWRSRMRTVLCANTGFMWGFLKAVPFPWDCPHRIVAFPDWRLYLFIIMSC